jgi:hypothetical protein
VVRSEKTGEKTPMAEGFMWLSGGENRENRGSGALPARSIFAGSAALDAAHGMSR